MEKRLTAIELQFDSRDGSFTGGMARYIGVIGENSFPLPEESIAIKNSPLSQVIGDAMTQLLSDNERLRAENEKYRQEELLRS